MPASAYELALCASDAYSQATKIPNHGDLAILRRTIGREHIFAVPGTNPAKLADWLRDLDTWPAYFKGLGVCHQGFGEAAAHVWDYIEPTLPAFGRMVYTGHSFGGAVALMLAARHMRDRPWSPCRVVVFGAPRMAFIGNLTIRGLIADALTASAFRRRGDIVPDVPIPPWFGHPLHLIEIGTAVADPLVNHEIERYIKDIATCTNFATSAL